MTVDRSKGDGTGVLDIPHISAVTLSPMKNDDNNTEDSDENQKNVEQTAKKHNKNEGDRVTATLGILPAVTYKDCETDKDNGEWLLDK